VYPNLVLKFIVQFQIRAMNTQFSAIIVWTKKTVLDRGSEHCEACFMVRPRPAATA